MAKFPEPPPAATLARLGALTATVPGATVLWRIYPRSGPHPGEWNSFRAFGPTGARFDHQLDPPCVQCREILYTARRGPTCFAEVFQDTRVIDTRRHQPWLVGFELRRAVVLLDLTGPWPTRAGASTAINSGPRPRARRWSRAIFEAYPDIDGILYGSSMDAHQPAIALYERAKDALPAAPVFHRALADPLLAAAVARAALEFNYAVV